MTASSEHSKPQDLSFRWPLPTDSLLDITLRWTDENLLQHQEYQSRSEIVKSAYLLLYAPLAVKQYIDPAQARRIALESIYRLEGILSNLKAEYADAIAVTPSTSLSSYRPSVNPEPEPNSEPEIKPNSESNSEFKSRKPLDDFM